MGIRWLLEGGWWLSVGGTVVEGGVGLKSCAERSLAFSTAASKSAVNVCFI